MFGIRDEELRLIREILSKYEAVQEALIFGSRTQADCKCSDDVDIAIKGELLTPAIAKEIAYELNEETLMTYRFDVVSFNTLQNHELIDQIESEGACFYEKKI